MIPRANITAWRKTAPWPDNTQVEQDLVLSHALVEMLNRPLVADQAVLRGGTAIHKLCFHPPGRYSEDIDLVQRNAGPVGPLITREHFSVHLADGVHPSARLGRAVTCLK